MTMATQDVVEAIDDISQIALTMQNGIAALDVVSDAMKIEKTAEGAALVYLVEKLCGDVQKIQAIIKGICRPQPAGGAS